MRFSLLLRVSYVNIPADYRHPNITLTLVNYPSTAPRQLTYPVILHSFIYEWYANEF
jgi:hypothetical protein